MDRRRNSPLCQGLLDTLKAWAKGILELARPLAIDVMNVDLAGKFEPWRALAYDVRIMRDVYPPRIMLRYKLTEEQRTLIEGEELVADINYLANPRARPAGDPLRYEKARLSDWFKVRIVEAKLAHAKP